MTVKCPPRPIGNGWSTSTFMQKKSEEQDTISTSAPFESTAHSTIKLLCYCIDFASPPRPRYLHAGADLPCGHAVTWLSNPEMGSIEKS